MATKKNDLVEAEENTFAVAQIELDEDFMDEMDGMTPTFDRIRIPSGGGLAYEVPGDDPDSPDMAKSFDAVILHQHPINVYYKDKYNGSNNPPDCGSVDGRCGVDVETGEMVDCVKCPRNKFGSAEYGKGKACKQKRRLYLLREGDMFPIIMTLPTGSISDYTKFLSRTVQKYGKTNRVVTKFSLKKAQNSGGINYSQAVLSVVRPLSEEEIQSIIPLSEQARAFATKTEFEEAE